MKELTWHEMLYVASLLKDLNKEERTFIATSTIYQLAQRKKLIELVTKDVP